jgi:hypothetical protein
VNFQVGQSKGVPGEGTQEEGPASPLHLGKGSRCREQAPGLSPGRSQCAQATRGPVWLDRVNEGRREESEIRELLGERRYGGRLSRSLEAVLAIYCLITNYPKSLQLKQEHLGQGLVVGDRVSLCSPG